MANTTNKITMSATDIKTALIAKQTELDAAKNALQDALRCDRIDPAFLKECRDKATAVCDEWNELNTQLVYAQCYETENPMLAACKYGAMMKKSVTEFTAENGTVTVKINERRNRSAIDLVDFNDRCPKEGNLFVNGQWQYYAETFAKAIASDVGKGLELNEAEQKRLNDSYKEALEDGKWVCLSAANPSTGNMVKDLQGLVDMILFIPDEKHPDKNKFKVFSRDARFVDTRKAKAGKALLSTRTIRGKEMLAVIGDVMYHLTTGNPYTIDC
nr:MAG TPA: hypothetical protein [Caudoviricetes sp.]